MSPQFVPTKGNIPREQTKGTGPGIPYVKTEDDKKLESHADDVIKRLIREAEEKKKKEQGEQEQKEEFKIKAIQNQNPSEMAMNKVQVLPSQFKSYPKDSTIFYRGYYFGEVSQFAYLKGNLRKIFEMTLMGIESSFNRLDLTLSDFIYLGLLRKIATLGDVKFFFSTYCPYCRTEQKVQGIITDFVFNDLNVSDLPIVVNFTFDPPETESHFYPLTIGQYLELIDKKLTVDSSALLAKMCRNRPFDEIYSKIQTALAEDSAILDEIDELLNHGLKPLEIKCKNMNCPSQEKGLIFTVELEGDEVMIVPSHDFRESVKNRIHFGKIGNS